MSSDQAKARAGTVAVVDWLLAVAVVTFVSLPTPLSLERLFASSDAHWSLGDTFRLAQLLAVVGCVPVLGRRMWTAAAGILAVGGTAALVGIHQILEGPAIAGDLARGVVEALVAVVYIVLIIICLLRGHLTARGEVQDSTSLVRLFVLLLNAPLALFAITPLGWWLFLAGAADLGSGDISGDAAYIIVVLAPIAVVWLVLRELPRWAAVASVIQGVAWLPAGWDTARGRFTEFALILCFLSVGAAISLVRVNSR